MQDDLSLIQHSDDCSFPHLIANYAFRHQWTCIFRYKLSISPLCQSVHPQWGAADAEIKVPSGENTELKRSPFKAWSRSLCSHTCYVFCQRFLPGLFLPFWFIHLHFFENLSRLFPLLAVANTSSCVGRQNKIDHPVWCRFPCWVPTEYR